MNRLFEKVCKALLLSTLTLMLTLVLIGAAPEKKVPLSEQIHKTGVRVVIVGIDGATLKVLTPELEAKKLPNFARLIQSGAHGELQSQKPLVSPAIWTTIATGKTRKEHGINLFTVDDGKSEDGTRLVGSFDRHSLALWEILSAAERQVGVLGWWATWPAESVRGWVVSDRMTRSRWTEWEEGTKRSHLTYPDSLADELSPLVVDPMKIPYAEIDKLVKLTAAEREEFRAARFPIKQHGLSVFKFAMATQRSFEEMALELFKRGQPDLGMIFLIANDPVSHTFWHYYEPEKFRGVDKKKAARLGKLVPNFYAHNDAYLGRLREVLDEDTVILIVSDHGFQASGVLPRSQSVDGYEETFSKEQRAAMAFDTVAIGRSGKHHPMGLFIAAGGPIRKAITVEANIYDIAPTVLALQGMPVPRDMPGRVLTEIIESEFLERFPIRRIDSYLEYVERKTVEGALQGAEADEDTFKMLRALGYID